VLVPGIGVQKGRMDILKIFKNTVVNVGRSIIYSERPEEEAEEYKEKIKKFTS